MPRLISDPEELYWVHTPVGLDLETTGCNPSTQSPVNLAQPFLMSLCWRGTDGALQTRVVHKRDIPAFKPWLEDERYSKVGHNLIHFDRHALANIGIHLAGILGDTLCMSRLFNPEKGYGHGLGDWARKLGYLPKTEAFSDLTSRPKPGARKVYKQTRTVNRDGVRYHYTEGAEVYNISFKSREHIELTELWEKYPHRRERVLEYAARDAELHLLVFERLDEMLAGVRW